jgi:hypothetical protein
VVGTADLLILLSEFGLYCHWCQTIDECI